MKQILCVALLGLSTLYSAEPVPHDVVATKEFLSQQPKALVLDVRTTEEFAEGHLDKAALVSIADKDFVESVKKLAPLDQPILVYCRSGSRSAKAIAALKAAGFTQLHELKGGITAWTEQKQAVIKP